MRIQSEVMSFYKKSLGIIGFGRIGKNIYKYAKSFDMIVRAYDPNKEFT